MDRYDVVVVGAGVFGAWTAWHLVGRGQKVLLVDAYGPANARASSGGESRIIRMGYGADEIYTRWSQRSLVRWKEFFGFKWPGLFHETGVLWLGTKEDTRIRDTASTLRQMVAWRLKSWIARRLENRYPQIGLDGIVAGLLEPQSGVLMAAACSGGGGGGSGWARGDYRVAEIVAPGVHSLATLCPLPRRAASTSRRTSLCLLAGRGSGKCFRMCLGSGFFPSRQEVFFLGVPAGEIRDLRLARCQPFCFQRMRVMGCRIWRGEDLRLRSTGMECGLIPIRNRGWSARRLPKRCSDMLGGDFRVCGVRRLWRRAFVNTRILRAGIF